MSGSDSPHDIPSDGSPARRIQALPHSSDNAEALFLLVCHSGGVYFANNSPETLMKVLTGAGGSATASDDDVVTMEEADGTYQAVRPGEAVLIGYHDGFYDLDFLWSYDVTVHCSSSGVCTFRELVGKGKMPGSVIMWRDLPPLKTDANGQLVKPVLAAEEYRTQTGRFLPRDVFLNQDDLTMPYAEARIAAAGLILKRKAHQGGKVTVYDFLDERDNLVFRAHNTQDAINFLNAVRGP